MASGGFPDDAGGPIESSAFGESREQEAKRRALEDPGASWKEWLYFVAFKWWLAIVFLILDSWVVTIFLQTRDWFGLGGATVAAIYLEYLLYGYLWRRPDPRHPEASLRGRWPPYGVGRWTPEGFRLRGQHSAAVSGEASPDPREFL
jgi:hypothetical protein